MPSFAPARKLLFVAAILLYQHAFADDGQFYGGSMSYRMKKRADGRNEVTIELITGWVLGEGPCGPGCSKADVGRSTRTTRLQMLTLDPVYLGNYTSDYLNRTTGKTETRDMNAIFNQSYNETVIAISENGKWEQELLHFSFVMQSVTRNIDINFDGYSWRKIAILLQMPIPSDIKWHFQTKISSAIRSDTGKTNESPRALAKPFYRIKLGTVTQIRIPAVDGDGDFIKCEIAYIEAGDISIHLPLNVAVHENCTVFIDASESNHYSDNTWIAVPVSVRDYNRKDIDYGGNPNQAATYSLSATTVQFTVQVLANLTTPEFVEPTFEGNHEFIMYAGTTWRTDIYAKATENTTIESLTAFGIEQEHLVLSTLAQDQKRPRVKYSTVSWKPSVADMGKHIVCFDVSDNTGVDSTEQRCFLLDVRADGFNYTAAITTGRPYFVDIPSPDQIVDCKIKTTCVIALYVKSAAKVTDVRMTRSNIDKYQFGPIQWVVHKGEQLYQVDLSFQHPIHGKEIICFIARDKNGHESDNVCIRSQIEPPNPCISAPCMNSATCVMDKNTGGFECQCLPKYSGKICSIKEDPCKPYPCVKDNAFDCYDINNILCYCKAGFTGPTCAENINDCTSIACNSHGSCKDKTNGFDCECFDRYNGTKCEKDRCPLQRAGVMNCPAAGCLPDPCNGQGVCYKGGQCLCPYGFSDPHCGTRKCIIPGAATDIEITSPSVKDGSRLVCYTKGDLIPSCHIRLYLAVKSGSSPRIIVDTTEELKSLITVGATQKSTVIPGISNLFTTDIGLSGRINSTKSHYVCVSAAAGNSKSSTCYQLIFTANPEDDPTTLAHTQLNAAVKFVQPTIKGRSKILCYTGEKCLLLLYTSFSSNRPSCNVSTTSPIAASNGSGRCDTDDKDNDEDDPDTTAKAKFPCCQDVLSSPSGVTVFPAHPRGPSCVSEASFTFPTAGEKDICFQSAHSDNQQLCYKVGVYDKVSDPCSRSPCQNNGHCFRTDNSNFKCMCPDKYIGDKCERGPCQLADNSCKNDAFCQIDDGIATCICKAGFSGPTCNKDPSDFHKTSAEFTDTAKPTVFPCVLHQICSVALILTGQSNHIPTVTPGYVHPSLLIEEIETTDRMTVQSSYQTDIRLKPLGLGVKDLCVQTKDTYGTNKDELCFKVNVVSDVISIYGFPDRPHFVDPSLPTNAEVECQAGGPCHVLYHVTPGKGNDNHCMTFHPHAPDGFMNYHLFSTCDTCKPGDPSNRNCTVDLSVVNTIADINIKRYLCLSVGLIGSTTKGEERCFNLTVTDPSAAGKKGCQILECKNGGFCDGHIPGHTTCFCTKGFSGSDCGKAEVMSPFAGSQAQTFIGDFALLSELTCVLNTACYIPFQIISKPGPKPNVSLGYVDPRISVQKPLLNATGPSGTVYEGSVVAYPKQVGVFKVCLQANMNSKTDDELCVTVDVINSVVDKTDQTKPHFLPPTITSDSTVLCEVKKACHFNMYFTKGDMFGFPGKCPKITVTSPNPAEELHTFDAKQQVTDCTTDVSYIPSLADGKHTLCVQVALPGIKGESRCYTVKIVTDIQREVISPCKGVTCENNGKCLADFNSSPPNISCFCKTGYTGNNCRGTVSINTDLPGIENLNVSSQGNQHFDVYSAIPKDVNCEVGHECCVNIPYHGESDKPPTTGYVDSGLSGISQRVLTTSSSDQTSHISQLCINGTKGGPRRICQQTTTNGTEDGINIDEMCFNITIHPEYRNHSQYGSHFSKSIPDGSTVLCKPNTMCHNPIVTARQSNGQCPQPSECGDGEPGVHVFRTNLVGNVCIADMAIKTGNSGQLNLCISSGSRGGEEIHLKVEVENLSSFGPCQKVHCLNGGSCVAEQTFKAVCYCQPGYTGFLCENDIDECVDPNICAQMELCRNTDGGHECVCTSGYSRNSINGSCLQSGKLVLEDAIDVKCTTSQWDVRINMDMLRSIYPGVTSRDIYLGQPQCQGSLENSTLKFQFSIHVCMTTETISGITNIYNNKLLYAVFDPVIPFLIRQHVWTFAVECDEVRGGTGTSHLQHGIENHHESFVNHYNVNVELFTDQNFLHPISGDIQTVHVGEDVYVKVSSSIPDWNTKMLLHTCFTRPNINATADLEVMLISDGCEVDTNTHIISQSTHETRFVFQDFEYVTYDKGLDVYCNATFCDSKDYSPGCVQSCGQSPSIVG